MTVFASRFRWGAIGVAAVCLVALAGYVLYRGKLGASPQSGYLTATVTRGSVESSVLATGTLKPHRWVAVGAQVSGRIEKLNVKLGDTVKAGDLIAQADVGADCYIVDDQTVAKTNGTNTRSVAGKIIAVDADGVWVKIGQ